MVKDILLLLFLLHSVSSLNIRIDGDNGIDSIECLTEQPQPSCQSLKYVADTINNTGNLTIEIISPTLSLQGSVIFTDINGLTINGQGTSITCNNGSMLYGNSGIVFDTCSDVRLNSFTIEHCGLLYEKEQYCKVQAILFYKCNNFVVIQVNFINNNCIALAVYDIEGNFTMDRCFFVNNSYYSNHSEKQQPTVSSQERKNCPLNFFGGALHLYQQKFHALAFVFSSKFINNSASGIGGALYANISDTSGFRFVIFSCQFIGNKADISGGAIAITAFRGNLAVNKSGYHIDVLNCDITQNMAQFGGGAALTISHQDSLSKNDQISSIRFELCNFYRNKAKYSSAVDISGNSQRLYQSVFTSVRLHYCRFIGNVAGIDMKHTDHVYKGKSFKATIFAIDALVEFLTSIIITNNTGTALHIHDSRVHFSSLSNIKFINNTGDHGGAILLAGNAVIDLFKSTVLFQNNTAVFGGAICSSPTVIVQYKGTCFLQKHGPASFQFINNTAIGGFGHDIFASTLEPCVQLYGGNTSTLFISGKISNFNFTSSSPPPVATAPVTLLINEKELVPYPGIPYNMTLTQKDGLDNNITNLQLFPLSATLQNEHNSSSLKIELTHSIANNYIIVFKGTVGDKATLLLQTTEYSARLFINITLYQCPPGYMFQTDTCHCNGNYYYGILHCLEDNNAAVIDTGLWAGYIEEKFATADCVTSLCDYYNSDSTKHGDHILPLNYSLLNDHVCALHRNGVLCGSCVTGYTTYLHSPSYHCGESTHCQYGPLLYIVSEIIPVTGIFLVILFFNINLTSGALYSFIFYSQIVNNHYGNTIYQSYNGPLIYLFHAFKIIYGIFDLEIFEIDQLSFCLFKDATIMDLMLIKYLTTLYALLLIIITILVLKFNSFHCCIKLCHKCGRRNIRGSIVNALTAFLVLCYFHCLVITLHILVPSYVMGGNEVRLKTIPLYNGDMSYMSGDHFKYVTPAIICLIVIILPPPIILLSEPLLVRVSGVLNIRRNAITYTLHRLRMKLKPFLDSFQGCFKDNCRCFAGLFFLYRILLVLIPIYSSDGKFWNIMTKEVLILCILFLHCLCSPFQEKFHNHIKSFLLIDLILINTLQLAPLNPNNSTTTLVAVFEVVLMSLPLAYLLCYIGHYIFCMRCCITNKSNTTSPSNVNNNNYDDDELPPRLLPEFTEIYNTFIND